MNIALECIQAGDQVTLRDNEFLGGTFVDSHYGWHVVEKATEHTILLRDANGRGIHMDKQVVYKVKHENH